MNSLKRELLDYLRNLQNPQTKPLVNLQNETSVDLLNEPYVDNLFMERDMYKLKETLSVGFDRQRGTGDEAEKSSKTVCFTKIECLHYHIQPKQDRREKNN
jgi:hypothetical protein